MSPPIKKVTPDDWHNRQRTGLCAGWEIAFRQPTTKAQLKN